MVPPTHGAWLAGNVPDITVTHKAQEGHISIVTNHLDELAAGFKKAFG